MSTNKIESNTSLSKSIIWKLNQSFYEDQGIDAWRNNQVPSHITSNSMVGKTYAEMLYAILLDLRNKDLKERIYFLEMGAGHGKLAFYILTHLERLLSKNTLSLPQYTYILSDLAEENLDFFSNNIQLKRFINNGLLDVSYYNASNTDPLYLRHSKMTIRPKSQEYPIIGIGNYFLDSIPTDLYKVENGKLYEAQTEVLLDESLTPETMQIKDLDFKFKYVERETSDDKKKKVDQILDFYRNHLDHSFLFFPTHGIRCMEFLKSCSKSGLIMLVMDKGFNHLEQLRHNREPEMIQHGSTSIWVNFNALDIYTELIKGISLSPSHSHVQINVAVYAWLNHDSNLENLTACYKRSVDDFGPNEINSLMKFSYAHIATLSLTEIIANLRMNQYDPYYFNKVLPRIKQICKSINQHERDELRATIPLIYELYFSLGEQEDFTYELGSLMFDMAYYVEAILYFEKSLVTFGPKPDVYFNMAICYYQLRMDKKFLSIKALANKLFPDYKALQQLDDLDLNAV